MQLYSSFFPVEYNEQKYHHGYFSAMDNQV